ncbi:MAG: PUR family DNA/RNA-binding protein [Bacteroidales bacterium]|nr:PUR family DNA/RNA-binding protein [Bacteroidales bacterium]
MEEQEKKEQSYAREEIFSRTVRAGKRTYFFDVKSTRSEEHYLTITESKRRFNNDSGKFFYEKHKLFLYKEDFEKFANGMNAAIEFIQTGKAPEEEPVEEKPKATPEAVVEDPITNVEFEDLGSEAEAKTEESTETEDTKK